MTIPSKDENISIGAYLGFLIIKFYTNIDTNKENIDIDENSERYFEVEEKMETIYCNTILSYFYKYHP